MTPPVGPLLSTNLRRWVSAKGFWLVAAAALILPLLLAGAWVGTHQADVAVTALTVTPANATEGDEVVILATITNVGSSAVDPFNSTVRVGTVRADGALSTVTSNESRTEGLGPGESYTVELRWNATPGLLFAVAFADQRVRSDETDLDEKSELNNFDVEPLLVRRRAPDPDAGPEAPAAVAGDENATATADLALSAINAPEQVVPGDLVSYNVVVRNDGPEPVTNATAVLRVASTFGDRFFTDDEERVQLTLAPGESRPLSLGWLAREGTFWVEAWVEPGPGVKDDDTSDNQVTRPQVVDVQITPDIRLPEPEKAKTILDYHREIVANLYLPLLIPLLAMFYAAGVIADEQDSGRLRYLLTKPLPRWTIPVTKFVASFLVAGVATVVGVAATYGILYATSPDAQGLGYLVTPLLLSLLALFAYGGLFTLVGVWSARPYLLGLAIALGWEYIVQGAISGLEVASRVKNLSVRSHVTNALNTWPLDEGVAWLPGDMRALWALLLIGLGSLVAAGALMRKREFDI